MLNPNMLDPAMMSFFKQAAPAFRQCLEAETKGKLDKALEKYCEGTRPNEVDHPHFPNRCRLYAAKAYAAAHIDGSITWGKVKELLEQSPAWPPQGALKPQGVLFLAYMIGFLHGSDLPADRHQKIEGLLPLGAQVISAPDTFARALGMNPDMLKNMAGGGVDGLFNFLKKDPS